MKRSLFILTLLVLLSGCQSAREKEYQQVIRAWTPEVRNAFLDMAKKKGCFSIKEITSKSGCKTSCYNSSSSFDKKKNEWVTECEPMCRTEVPECYADGWDPPISERCKVVEEWHRKHDKEKGKNE